MIKPILHILFLALSILCAGYGFVVMGARSGTKFFLVWFLAAAFFLACALVARFGWPAILPRWTARVCAVLVAAGVLLLVAIEGQVLAHFREKGEPGLDVIIVLGAQIRETGPTVVLRWRLDAAYEYLATNPGTRCIVSGGQGANEPRPEADAMKDYLVERGISPERILTETASRNTVENILNSMNLFDADKDSVGIVTNDFHMYRPCHRKKEGDLKRTGNCGAFPDALFTQQHAARMRRRVKGRIDGEYVEAASSNTGLIFVP